MARVPRCLTVASSDSGGGAGIQADLKAFAAAGCHGLTALVAVTAQNTVAVTAVHQLPPDVVTAQLQAVFDDIGWDVAKTGALPSAALVRTVAAFFRDHPTPLVVDPVLATSTGTRFAGSDTLAAVRSELLPLATVITPNRVEAEALTDLRGSAAELAERLVAMGARGAVITGGDGDPVVDHVFDGSVHTDLQQRRARAGATHGSGCTHSATLAARLAHGDPLLAAARAAAAAAAGAIEHGVRDLGAGEGPVEVLHGCRDRRAEPASRV